MASRARRKTVRPAREIHESLPATIFTVYNDGKADFWELQAGQGAEWRVSREKFSKVSSPLYDITAQLLYNCGRADFWELQAERGAEWRDSCEKFSKVSSLLYLLYEITAKLTFFVCEFEFQAKWGAQWGDPDVFYYTRPAYSYVFDTHVCK